MKSAVGWNVGEKLKTRGYIDATSGQGGLAPTLMGGRLLPKCWSGKESNWDAICPNFVRKCPNISENVKNPIKLTEQSTFFKFEPRVIQT